MRALYASLVALCLVIAGGRPTEARVRDVDGARLTLATAHAAQPAASLARRTGHWDARETHARLVGVVPTWSLELSPPRLAVLGPAERAVDQRPVSFVSTRSSRGPPRS